MSDPPPLTDLYTWMAGSVEKVSYLGRHLANGKKPSELNYFQWFSYGTLNYVIDSKNAFLINQKMLKFNKCKNLIVIKTCDNQRNKMNL